MNNRLAALFGSLLLAVAPAFTPASAQPAAAPAAAPAVAVNPANAKAARELLAYLGYREQLAARFQLGASQLPQIILRANTERINANPKLTADQKKAELAIMTNEIPRMSQNAQRVLADPKLLDDAIDAIVPIYASKFTLAELNEMNAFQKRPVAAKMRTVMPQVSQEASAVVQNLMRERVVKLIQKPQ